MNSLYINKNYQNYLQNILNLINLKLNWENTYCITYVLVICDQELRDRAKHCIRGLNDLKAGIYRFCFSYSTNYL